MYKKVREEHGMIITEHFQSWYDILWEGWIGSLLFILVGFIGLLATPILAIRSVWNPDTARHGHESRPIGNTIPFGNERVV